MYKYIIVAVLVICTQFQSLSAEQLSYIDGAGNIHFVDSVSQIPQRYRAQVVPPTPTPVIDANAVRQIEQERREYEQQQRLRQQKNIQQNNQFQIDQNRKKTEDDIRRRMLEDKAHLERAR